MLGMRLVEPFREGDAGGVQTVRVSTSSNDEAEAAFEPFFPGVEIGAAQGKSLRFEFEAHASAGVALIECSLAGPNVRAQGEGNGFVVAQIDIDGELAAGRDIIDASQPFLYPQLCTTTLDRAKLRFLELDPDAVNRFARADLGDDNFHVAPIGIAPITAQGGRMWNTVSRHVADRMRDGSADLPLIGATLNDLLIATYLNTFPTTWSDARRREDASAGTSAAVRRARSIIDERFRAPLTSADIAEGARLSLRGLRDAFRRELDTTPTAYLRKVRLAEARRALLRSDPADTGAVSRAATAAGFTHLSRFSAAYRDEFGELPSTTVRH